MKKTLWIALVPVVLIFAWYLLSFRYYGNTVDKQLVEQSFRDLVDAWQRNDTNAVRSLCVSEFDPYCDSAIAHFEFQMEHQSSIGNQVLQRILKGDYAYQPNARRDWSAPFSHYFLGQVYFYRKDNDRWKFTGRTDYHVD